jgi:DNA-directed RNA polymerase sigma subunit (sigma70/sigma32)
MLTIEEANDLMTNLIQLRNKKNESKEALNAYRKHEANCVSKFSYMIKLKASKYKFFSNYEDLIQEGYKALLYGMNNFDPATGGNIFWWLHKYIDTRISRSANTFSTVIVPLKVAKDTPPHIKTLSNVSSKKMHSIFEHLNHKEDGVEKMYEDHELYSLVTKNFDKLNDLQKDVITMKFGINNQMSLPIDKICEIKNISRIKCLKLLNSATNILKRSVNY